MDEAGQRRMDEAGPSKRGKFECDQCHQTFDRVERLKKHRRGQKIKCGHCSKTFCNSEVYQKHLRSIVKPVQNISSLNQLIQTRTAHNGDAGFQAIILGKGREILDWDRDGRRYKIINRAINHTFKYGHLHKLLFETYKNNKNGFKITIGFGFVLFNPITEKYKYFYVGENNELFSRAYTVDSMNDMDTFFHRNCCR